MSAASELGLRVDEPLESWPPIENSAGVFVIADSQMPAGRRLLTRFLGRAGAKRAMREADAQWVSVFLTHKCIVVHGFNSETELQEAHRAILDLAGVARGHLELFHALDRQLRRRLIDDARAYTLLRAPIGGCA